MSRRLIKLSAVSLFFLMFFSCFAQEQWKSYPYQEPNTEIRFPDDEGSHKPVKGLEWWYVVIHGAGQDTGDKYSILVTHFNNQIRFFTITNVTRQTHKSGSTVGYLDSKKGALDLTHLTPYGLDSMRNKKDSEGNLLPFEYELETFHSDMHLTAQLKSIKKPMIVGGTGYVPIGSSGNSWYYSLSRLDVEAVVTFDGVTEKVVGTGWMDHQWGPFLVSPVEFSGIFETYEWFCVQLDNGDDIMISNIYDLGYNLPHNELYGRVQYSDADGNFKNTFDWIFTRTGYWQDPESGHYMSMGWELEVPEWDMELTLTPEFKQQMVKFPLNGDFWEGSIAVTGTLKGDPVTGRAFGELIHRFEVPRLRVGIDQYPSKMTYGMDESVKVNWKVLNPDDGNPLTFNVELINAERNIMLAQDIDENSLEFVLSDVLNPNTEIHNFNIKVTASSVDGTITNDKISPKLWLDGTLKKIFDNDGVVQPDTYHQRYRRDEFDPDEPFYQWWYYTIKDLKNNRYFAFDYSISDCVSDFTNEGAYMMFAMVDKNDGTAFHKYERFPLENFQVENDYDLQIVAGNVVDYQLEVIDADTYHVTGKMNNLENVWFADGCDEDLLIEWDLTIHRIYGWYGQQDIQQLAKTVGLINWNTYGHDSEVEGYIKVGDTTYTFERNEDFRAYCDMNWGENFPAGNPSIEYPWGWYYAGLPNADTAKDFSIIAGIGRHDLYDAIQTGNNPLSLTIPGIGKFADIRLDKETHIGVRSVEGFPKSPEAPGIPAVVTTNDGHVKQFKLERDDWVEYSDAIGTAMIPLHQKVTIETEHYVVTLDYHSDIEEYNRLLFPHEDYIFSDFEALGVDVHVVVKKRTYLTAYNWWDMFHLFPIKTEEYETLFDFWSDDGGLEYGYDVD